MYNYITPIEVAQEETLNEAVESVINAVDDLSDP
jgi:hypothetical protein